MKSNLAPRELVVGSDGFVGRALCQHLPDVLRTTRRLSQLADGSESGRPYFDLSYFDMLKPTDLPRADIVYLCAGVNGNLTCAQDPQKSYRVNVDGTIWVAEHCRDSAFVVWISSTTVEWLVEHYGRQKRLAEMHLRTLPHVGIVRAGRVMRSNIDSLCQLMIHMGRNKRRGPILWNEDEKPYQH